MLACHGALVLAGVGKLCPTCLNATCTRHSDRLGEFHTLTFRLTAYVNHNVLLFEADTNPKAKMGADLLDIGGKVNYIGVNSNQDGTTELAAIKNPKQVAQLVAMVLSAPVDQTHVSQGGPQYFLAFHLKDGTVVIRAYWLNSGELTRGILLPKAFGSVVAHALKT